MKQADQTAIRSIVERQFQAFRADDAIGAFAYASPSIQAQFETPENFMQMVRLGYAPVYRPRSVVFEDIITVEGMPAQKVMLMSAEGELVMALYLMQQQRDGSWRIHGCLIVPIEGRTPDQWEESQ